MRVSHDQAQQGERELRLKLRFDPDTLRLEHSLIGVVVHLGDCVTAGPPGAPALPVFNARIALPRGTHAVATKVEALETTRLSDAPIPLAPIQPRRPGATRVAAYSRPGERLKDPKWRAPASEERQPGPKPFPTPAYVPPDPELYAAAAREPSGRLIGTDTVSATPVATVALRPVRIGSDGHLEFSAELDIVIELEATGGGGDDAPSNIVSRAQALRDIALTRLTVINPEAVLDYSRYYPIELITEADYLIVTDNNLWNAATQAPAGPAGGDIAAAFRRLAQWKRQRGLTAKVVTVTDIVGGRWGDFRTGSRDLQETLRNFLKMAHSQWGVAWVLIGGDTSVVPIRHAAGALLGGIARQTDNPPPDNASVWAGDHLRMHVVNAGVWWGASPDNKLVRIDDGRLIPYDPAGTSSGTSAGWYFTTSETYATRSAIVTEFVRVNGPASLINGDLQFLYTWNTIPTDLYYSSLVGPNYDQPGKHDWDLVDNGVYGQCTSGNELDGVNYTPTVSLGRAPVSNSADADAFVSKLIAYEKFERPDGTPLQEDWPGRAVIVSENWGGRLWIGASAASPPGPNLYHHPAGAAHSIVNLEAEPDWNWSLLCYIAENDVRLLPYRTDAGPGVPGWFFARSDTDLSPNVLILPTGVDFVELPMVSQWLAVFGAPEELTPMGYIFNNIEIDGSLADQEQLRAQLALGTGLSAPMRLYEDIQDMTPDQLAAGPLELITGTGLRAALDAGPHIVSLSGHGSSNGCCKLSYSMASTLANGFHTFIGYADSCLTSQVDGAAMGEALLINPNGGAVAYIGSTRFSWIGVGDNFQRLFFSEWATLGGDAHLGLLADTRGTLFDTDWLYSRWAVLSLNLLGCPEMPIWWRKPLIRKIPEIYYPFDRIRLWWVDDPDPPFRVDIPYREEWNVTRLHVRQGEHEQMLAFRGESIDTRLEGFRPGPATITVSRAGHKPIVSEVRIRRRTGGWLVAGLVLIVALAILYLAFSGP